MAITSSNGGGRKINNLSNQNDVQARLLKLGTATLYEASGLNCDLDPAIRPLWQGANICGPALPVLAAVADNLPLHIAITQARPGEVIVVNAASTKYGYWGEVLTIAAQVRGIAGLVIDGAVRDTTLIEHLRFPLFSNGVAIRRTTKRVPGMIGDQIEVGGVLIKRGDMIVADADGIISLPQKEVMDILQAAQDRAEKERGYVERLRKGESTINIYGFNV